jgi:hypothetical protein
VAYPPVESDYWIQPQHIDTSSATKFKGAFEDENGYAREDANLEASALIIVRFCKARGNWAPFTLGDLVAPWQGKNTDDTVYLRGLFDAGLMVDVPGDPPTMAVAPELVEAAFMASPMLRT